MLRRRPLLHRVPRVGSPASSLLPRRSDFSSPGSLSFSPRSPFPADSTGRRRDLPGSWATLVHVPRASDPGEGGVTWTPGTSPLRCGPAAVAFHESGRVGPHHHDSFGAYPRDPRTRAPTLRSRPHGRPRKTRSPAAVLSL